MPTLFELFLDDNLIGELHKNFFQVWNLLVVADLSKNRLRSIPDIGPAVSIINLFLVTILCLVWLFFPLLFILYNSLQLELKFGLK